MNTDASDGGGAVDTDADSASAPWPSLLRPENWTQEVTTLAECPQTAGVTDEKSQLWSEAGGRLAPSSAFYQLCPWTKHPFLQLRIKLPGAPSVTEPGGPRMKPWEHRKHLLDFTGLFWELLDQDRGALRSGRGEDKVVCIHTLASGGLEAG